MFQSRPKTMDHCSTVIQILYQLCGLGLAFFPFVFFLITIPSLVSLSLHFPAGARNEVIINSESSS